MIIIFGAQATGKTYHQEAFRRHYRCRNVWDVSVYRNRAKWEIKHLAAGLSHGPVHEIGPQAGDLVLSCARPQVLSRVYPAARLIAIADARAEIGVEPIPEAGFLPPRQSRSVTAEADDRQWSWWAGEGEGAEHFTVNEASREAVIAAARREFGDDVPFTIVCATQYGPFETDIFGEEQAEEMIDRFYEANSGRWDEEGCEDPGFTFDELAAAMNAAFGEFIRQRQSSIQTYSFTEQRHREVIDPQAP